MDELDPPSFEDSQLDPLVTSSLTPLGLSTPQFDFPDPGVSHGSPSSVQAEFDQDQDADFDSDGFDTKELPEPWYDEIVTDIVPEDVTGGGEVEAPGEKEATQEAVS